MTTTVLIVGLILLLTTLIGGLVLLMRSQESLTVTIIDEGTRRKVIVAGAADTSLSAAMFSALAALPAELPSTAAGPNAAVAPLASPEEKTCPQCAEPVRAQARICRFCGHNFEDGAASS